MQNVFYFCYVFIEQITFMRWYFVMPIIIEYIIKI